MGESDPLIFNLSLLRIILFYHFSISLLVFVIEPLQFLALMIQRLNSHLHLIDLALLLLVDLVTHDKLLILLAGHEVTTIEVEWLKLVEDLGDARKDSVDVGLNIILLTLCQLDLPLQHVLVNLHSVYSERQLSNYLLL